MISVFVCRKLFTFTFLFCLVLSVTMGIHVEFQKQEYEVARDDPVDLICTFQTKMQNSPVIITWSADPDDPAEPLVQIFQNCLKALYIVQGLNPPGKAKATGARKNSLLTGRNLEQNLGS